MRAWDIEDGDMNGEEGECVGEVERSAVKEVLKRAALQGAVDATLRSRNRWSRAVRYSESPSTSRKQSTDPYDVRVRLQIGTSPEGVSSLTILPTGSGEGSPWWLREELSNVRREARPT